MFPVLLTLPWGGYEVQSYGFFLGLALLMGWLLALHHARADKLPAESLGTVYVLAAAAGVLCARWGWLFQHPDALDGWRSAIALAAGGMAPFAGAFGAWLVSGVGANRLRVPVWAWLDCLAPALLLGVALERFGAFLAGVSFGTYAPNLPTAVQYPAGSPALAFHRSHLETLLASGANESLPVHPVQLYVVAVAILGLVGLRWIRARRAFSGQLILSAVMLVLGTRLLLEEPLRADADTPVLGPLSDGQVAGLIVLAALAVAYRLRALKARSRGTELQQWTGGPWTPKDS